MGLRGRERSEGAVLGSSGASVGEMVLALDATVRWQGAAFPCQRTKLSAQPRPTLRQHDVRGSSGSGYCGARGGTVRMTRGVRVAPGSAGASSRTPCRRPLSCTRAPRTPAPHTTRPAAVRCVPPGPSLPLPPCPIPLFTGSFLPFKQCGTPHFTMCALIGVVCEQRLAWAARTTHAATLRPSNSQLFIPEPWPCRFVVALNTWRAKRYSILRSREGP